MDADRKIDVDEELERLGSDREWMPNPHRALLRLHGERARRSRAARWRVVLGCAAVVACFGAAALMEMRRVSASDRVLKDRQVAPDFVLKDGSGAVIQLSAFRDRVVLLNFWATWCGGCKTEIPWFIELEKRYGARGFTVIGVSMDDDGFQSVTPFFRRQEMNYPVVIGNERLAKQYGVESMPETLLIDGRGKIAALHLGLVDKPALESQIRSLLN